jgi:hypothetical protein
MRSNPFFIDRASESASDTARAAGDASFELASPHLAHDWIPAEPNLTPRSPAEVESVNHPVPTANIARPKSRPLSRPKSRPLRAEDSSADFGKRAASAAFQYRHASAAVPTPFHLCTATPLRPWRHTPRALSEIINPNNQHERSQANV